MRAITILEKSYGSLKIAALKAFRQALTRDLEGLLVQINKVSVHPLDWVTIELEGEDEVAAFNLLKQKYGALVSISELEPGQTRKGRLIETGKYGYGLFIDIGIDSTPRIDGFLPLYTLRKQLANDAKVGLRELIQAYGFLDHLVLEIEIESVDKLSRKVQIALSKGQVDLFKDWSRLKLERLLISGVSRHHLKKLIIQRGHFRDIVAIERLGLLEEMVICKQDTNAKGLLAAIGSFLPDIRIELFLPDKVRQYLK